MPRRAAVVVLDGVGIGEAPDAATYGDTGSNTLANLARAVGGMRLPNLERAGLGCIAPIAGVRHVSRPTAAHGMLVPASAGKDSTAGHWEIAGVHIASPFPTYPNGFPREILTELTRRTGRGVLGNCVGSGTTILATYGESHQRTGAWIVYTSADSVFQIAAHEETVPLAELYRCCEIARAILVEPHDVSRVIARPFRGAPGSYLRTRNRRDFSIQPPDTTLLDALADAGIARAGVGKVDDLFAGRSITSRHTADNADGLAHILRWARATDAAGAEDPSAGRAGAVRATGGFLFANLVDFDQLYGHRNDIPGFYQALRDHSTTLSAVFGEAPIDAAMNRPEPAEQASSTQLVPARNRRDSCADS